MYVQEKKIVVRDFPVIKDYGEEESFFRLQTEGGEVHLPKLAFQRNLPLPDTLNCRIKGYNGNLPMLAHNMPRYVNEFYADGFSKGQEFEFKVVSKPNDEFNFYRLEDENGLQFKLNATKSSPLAIGQAVKCKFDHIDPNVFILRRSATDSQLRMMTFRDFARILNLRGQAIADVENIVRGLPEMAKAMDEYDRGLPSWIFTAARAVRTYIPKWFKSATQKYDAETVDRIIQGVRRILLYMLEGSDFLRNIRGQERTSLQSEITSQIEQIEIYSRAHQIIKNNKENNFIDNLLFHLKESGFIYHPTQQFAIMMILFRTYPNLVKYSLGNIFDTLTGWYPETWKAEPFRQAFVEQFEIYISESREDIDSFLMPVTADDNEKIVRVLTAIAIQQNLASTTDNIDMKRNMSLFFRCLSLLRNAKADVLLNKSLLSLMDVKLPTDFTWLDLKETSMMMTRAAVDPPSTAKIPERYQYHIADKVEIEAGPNGITIQRTDCEAPQQVPNGVLPWHDYSFHINANIEHTFNKQRLKSLEGHAEFWSEVEGALFQPPEAADAHAITRRAPDIDDEVRIIIDRIIPSSTDPNRAEAFHCKIVDDHFFEGDGIMMAEDLVSYNLHGVTIGAFRNDKNQPMQFEAKVVDIDMNDRLHFSLIDTCRMAIRDLTFSGDSCYAVVTKDNGRSYSAISEKGFGLYIEKDPKDPVPYRAGNVLCVKIKEFNNDYVKAVVEYGPCDGIFLNNAQSLHELLKTIAIADVEEDDVDIDEENLLTRVDIRELAQILRYKAVSCSENILEAFDFLSYARILARTIGDEELAEIIKAHKEILLLHQHYAKNKQIFREDVDHIVDTTPESTLITRLANKLDLVASLGEPDDNPRLWAIADGEEAEDLKSLAKMVLSFNLLYDSTSTDAAASAIKEKIAKTLNVSSEQRNLKYYGSESQYVEFKSSLVYPAQKGKSGISLADPDRQEYEILHIIAGFMNTTGGTLYIGVNDDHYERGLEEDMRFYKLDTSERNTIYRRNIKSLDNMANYLQNLIDRSFNIGMNAGDYAKAYIDDESTKGVIAVKIIPCQHVIKLNGTIYVRHSAKTTPLTTPDEIEQFENDRLRLYRQQKKAAEPETTASPQPTKPTAMDVASAGESAKVDEPETISVPSEKTAAKDSMAMDEPGKMYTSRVRPNILHEYESENFVTPSFYIRFVNDHEYIVTNDEWSIEDNDRMALTVTNNEIDQYLLLVYEDENVIKVPMREIAKKKMNAKHSHYGDRKLIFACPITAGSGLYSIHSNSRGTVYERFTPIDSIDSGSMGSAPSRIMDVECYDSCLWEVVPATRAIELEPIKSTYLKRAQIGSLAKANNAGRVTSADVIESFYQQFPPAVK